MNPPPKTRKAAPAKRPSRRPPALVYLSYSRDDLELVFEFARQARAELQDSAEIFFDMAIGPGDEWDRRLREQLARARVVLFFLSPRALRSDYIRTVEMPTAIERADKKREPVAIVPVLLAPCEWQQTPIARWQLFPPDLVPIATREDREPAWRDLVAELRRLIAADGEPAPTAPVPLPTGTARLRLALQAALDRPAEFELLERLDEAELQAVWQTLLRSHRGNADAALAALETRHPGIAPHPLWSAWVATVSPARLGP